MATWDKQEFISSSLSSLNNDNDKILLQDEINTIDLSRINSIYSKCVLSPSNKNITDDMYEPLSTIAKLTPENKKKWEYIGLDHISNNKVAVVLLAGGQGSRLGYNHPKGMYDFGLLSHKSLFQIQAERIINLQERAKKQKQTDNSISIPWYIMTSDATHLETIEYFNNNNYFGLNKDNIKFFKQSKLPATNTEGQILLSSPTKIFQAPDGNGGVYAALVKSNYLQDMKTRNIETIFMYGVDNALVRVADPVFIGSFLESKHGCGAKVVPKAFPEEKVGILCKKQGIVQVIEYSEISNEMAHKTNQDGSLTFNAGNIVTHIFSLDCLQDICKRTEEMPYHLAKKQIEIFNPKTNKYEKIQGYKYEQFVFDSFQLVKDIFALQVIRSQEFTAIKNKEGKDSPQTALQDISNYHKSLLIKAGAIIKDDNNDLCEISPLISYAGENLNVKDKIISTPFLLE